MSSHLSNLEVHHQKCFAFLYSLLASFFLATSALLVKVILSIPPSQILGIRAFVSLIFNSILANRLKLECYLTRNQSLSVLLLRSLLGSISAFLWVSSIHFVNLSEAIILYKTTSFWTAILSLFLLRRGSKSIKMLSELLLCAFGVIFIIRPPDLYEALNIDFEDFEFENHLQGVVYALLAALILALIEVLAELPRGKTSWMTAAQFLHFACMILPLLFEIQNATSYQMQLKPIDCLILALGGITYSLGNIFTYKSYCLGPKMELQLIGELQFFICIVYDFSLPSHSFSWLSLIGMSLVFIALVSAIFNKHSKMVLNE